MSNDDNDIDRDDVRTVLAFSAQEIAKGMKVQNDALVSVLNNEVAIELKSDDEHQLAMEAYLDTKSAIESLYELTDSLDESDEDEPSVAEQWEPSNSGEEQQ